MLRKVETYLQKNKLLSVGAPVIVGTSGGADSVALLHVLKELGYKCVVAHCNFHLRGEESDRDEQFVAGLSLKLGLPYCKTDFDTATIAGENKISIEMAARDLRYNWFEELRQKLGAEAIAVAHHADDNAETLLMNLTRGTGLRGMTGIPVRNGYVVRPLLCCNRNEIINYLQKNNLNYVDDSTNFENEYTRNRFRNEIIPLFEKINPSFRETLNETINRFEEIEQIYNEHITALKNELCFTEDKNTIIDTTVLKKIKYAKTVLYEILAPCNFHTDTISNVLNALNNEPGAVFYSQTHQLLLDRDRLILSERVAPVSDIFTINAADSEITEPVHLKITVRKHDGTINKQVDFATLDAAKVTFPLTLRHWHHNDRFVPYGMKTRKKLSDFFIDNKINRFEKENIWLLLSGDDIVWIVGYRVDNRFAVDETTTEVIEFQLIK